LATEVDSIPETRYVNREAWYMKIQKPGSDSFDANTPQKIRESDNKRSPRLPPSAA
jgi:hypothetical protein